MQHALTTVPLEPAPWRRLHERNRYLAFEGPYLISLFSPVTPAPLQLVDNYNVLLAFYPRARYANLALCPIL